MSVVTDIVLLTSIEESGVREIQDWLKAEDWPPLVEVSDRTVGGRVMQCGVYIGAVNYFDLEGFLAAARAVSWDYPESVRLLVKEEEDESFKLVVWLRSGISVRGFLELPT